MKPVTSAPVAPSRGPTFPPIGDLTIRLVEHRIDDAIARRTIPAGYIGRDVAAFLIELDLDQIALLGRGLIAQARRKKAA